MTVSVLLEEVCPDVAWLKVGDTAATNPRVLRAAAHGDARVTNEVMGFVTRCAAHSAGHETDGVIDEGEAALFGGSRTYALAQIACKTGLFTKMKRPKTQPIAWKICDEPDLFNIQSKDELDWRRQRDRDNANPALVVPVRLRDGDACRYCRDVVNWNDRRSGRGGTYDHRTPGKPATVETLVVSCFACNRRRGNNPKADVLVPLRPAPLKPLYGPQTLKFLADNGIQRPGIQPDTATLPGDVNGAGDNGSGDAHRGADLQIPQIGGLDPGSGRDGPGRVGPGPPGSPAAPQSRRRGKRGGQYR